MVIVNLEWLCAIFCPITLCHFDHFWNQVDNNWLNTSDFKRNNSNFWARHLQIWYKVFKAFNAQQSTFPKWMGHAIKIFVYRNIKIISNGQNIIQSGRSPFTDMFYLMINNSSKWHCYTLLASIFTKECFISLTVVSDTIIIGSMISNIVGPGFSSTSFACLISNGI